jgi:hypothetical protein
VLYLGNRSLRCSTSCILAVAAVSLKTQKLPANYCDGIFDLALILLKNAETFRQSHT